MERDQVTGYQDEVICECKPCKSCDGEGGGVRFVTDFAHRRTDEVEWTCSVCHGTGKDADDCAVHGEQPVERLGAMAFDMSEVA